MKSILDPTFKYTSSANTDLRKTFACVRREERQKAVQRAVDAASKVAVLPTKREAK